MTPFQRLGGAPVARALAHEFYDLVDRDPRYATLSALHVGGTAEVRIAFEAWLTAWLGGPPLPPPADPTRGCIMSRHRAMGFGPEPAEQWIAAMDVALSRHVPDAELAALMRTALTRMARAMAH